MLSRSAPTGYISSRSSYKENRLAMKNGFIVSCLILFKSTISVGMLNNQMYYFGSGWLLGIIISAAITYLITYGMILVCEVAQDVEKKNKMVEIDTFETLAMYITKSPRASRAWYIGRAD